MRRVDSDDEPPAAAAATAVAVHSRPVVLPHGVASATAPRTQHALALVCSRESDSLTELYVQLKHRYDGLSALPRAVPSVVSFCVGGRAFAVSRALLEKDPGSLLFALTAQHYSGLAVAGDAPCGAVLIPNRNAQLFGMLLNLLRGYRTAIPEGWMEVCREEAAYYGLLGSWNARFHVAATQYYFRNPMRNSKLASEAVLGVASDFLTAGEHHIDFCVSQCDRVAIGLISSSALTPEEPGTQLHDGHHGAFYWNDGKLSFYLGEPRIVETGFPFPAGAVIRVAFDADERIARWVVNGEYCVAMERLPAGRQYAFSSIAARTSQVTIVSA